MKIFVLIAFSVYLSVVAYGSDSEPFPLSGLWKVVGGEKEGMPISIPGGAMEFEFLQDGVLLVTVTDPEKNIFHPIRMKWSYTFIKPDIVTYTFTGSPVERQRFTIDGDSAYFQHLDYQIKSALKRINKTEFKEEPVESKDLPK